MKPSIPVSFTDIFNRALKILSLRDHSIYELRSKLLKRFEDSEQVEQVLKKLLELHYLDDERFAELLVRSLRKKGKSRFFMRQELQKRGVEARFISTSLSEVDEFADAFKIASKKEKSLTRHPKEKQRQKLAAFLGNRGFSFDIVNKVLRELEI